MFKELLEKEFSPYGHLISAQLEQLEAHYNLLLRWNQRLNLTRITSLEDAVRFHYCESLFLALSLPTKPLRIVDIGSGGGFPGIPVAIFRPDCELTLVESHQRKAVFLREASRNIANIRVIAARAEEVNEKFDLAISRAVSLSELVSLGLAGEFNLLVGASDAAQLTGSSTRLPWGKDRVLFHVKRQNQM